MLRDDDSVVPARPSVHPYHTVYNREAIIPPMCYTRSEGKHNPCYVCHQEAVRGRPNTMNDGELQRAYSFSELGTDNHWKNLFEDRTQRVAEISDEAIQAWVSEDNYSELAERLRKANFKGYVPDLKDLELGAKAFDAEGFARDGSHWVAFSGAADELRATPYGRPEDMEMGKLANGNEVMYFAATSENAVYSVEMLPTGKAMVRVFASETGTPKNVGFAPTTGALNSPDNLAQDGAGNIYVIEDAPNGSSTGGDIWFVRDENNDGVGESLDHFLSVRVAGSEATGMIFDPNNPTQFVVAVQHPNSTDLTSVPDGFGDALWAFDIAGTVPVCGPTAPPSCRNRNTVVAEIRNAGNNAKMATKDLRNKCARAMRQQMNQD